MSCRHALLPHLFEGFARDGRPVHHGDACAFLGQAGWAKLETYGDAGLVASLREDAADWLPTEEPAATEAFERHYRSLERGGEPIALVFRCLHCDALVGYSDNG